MKKMTFLALFLALLLAGCQKEEAVLTEDQAVEVRNGNGKVVDRPFKGWVAGFLPTSIPLCDNGEPPSGELSGNLTHLGNTRVEYTACRLPLDPEASERYLRGFRTQGIYIAPPLDTIIIITDFFTSPSQEDPEMEMVEGIYRIIGGKGRFKNAFGRGAISGTAPADPAEFQNREVTFKFDGRINY